MSTIILQSPDTNEVSNRADLLQDIKEKVQQALESLEGNDMLLFVEQANEMATIAMEQFRKTIWRFSEIIWVDRLQPPATVTEERKLNLALWLRARVNGFREESPQKQGQPVILVGDEEYLRQAVSILLEEEPSEEPYGLRYEGDVDLDAQD